MPSRSPITRRLAIVLAATLTALALRAQPVVDTAAFHAFGDKPGLVRLMDDFMDRLLADARTAPFFKKADLARVKAQLVDQFCAALAGPCTYEGVDMKEAHQDLEIHRHEFNALVELLQQAMAAREIPLRAQNQLLARLAPLHREIITAR